MLGGDCLYVLVFDGIKGPHACAVEVRFWLQSLAARLARVVPGEVPKARVVLAGSHADKSASWRTRRGVKYKYTYKYEIYLCCDGPCVYKAWCREGHGRGLTLMGGEERGGDACVRLVCSGDIAADQTGRCVRAGGGGDVAGGQCVARARRCRGRV